MNFNDEFKPYSLRIRGDLLDYLRSHDGSTTDNHFCGSRYFFVIQRRELIIPELTCVRVGQSPVPDILYFVNSDGKLESRGVGEYNMSCVGAKKGIYEPREALKGKHWSIHHLKLEEVE